MTPEQKGALLSACTEGDDVRIVTVALSIAATHARAGDTASAMSIRRLVDDHQGREERERERQRMRDEFAKVALAGIMANPGTIIDCSEAWACKRSYVIADLMLKERDLRPVIGPLSDTEK